MQIDRIKISNFKSIPELDLNFQEMTGMWEISGVTGAGKTTIGEAIIFALFGSVRGKTNENLIMWGRKHALIEAWVYTKNRHLYIRREINSYGQSPLTATIEGEEILGSDKRSIQGILESEWYDVSRQTLELLCVISFNNFKSLSTLSTADSREFLNSTVAFDKIEAYENYCKEQMKTYEEKIRNFELSKRGMEGAIKALDETVPKKPKYDDLEEAKRFEKEALDAYNKLTENWKHQAKILKADFDAKTAEYKTISVTLKNIESNYKKLEHGTCPICGQKVTPEHRAEMHEEIEQKREEQNRCKNEMDSSALKCREYDAEMGEKREALDDKHSLAKWERMKTEEYGKQMKVFTEKRKTYQDNIKTYEGGIEECRKHVEEWKEMLDFIRDVARPTIISSIIPNVNKYISHYMVLAHQNYVVYFDDNFKCMMRNPFNDPIPVSSLSTGQKKVIDMIIILAFIKTFITQIDFNVYFMDELVGNIDADLRDSMCELLRSTVDEKDVMFLISHTPINQQYLDGIIKVSRTSGISEYSIVNISK